jgi:mannosyltransferase OCH1-like enzyme/SAM-dependent methyltransferase
MSLSTLELYRKEFDDGMAFCTDYEPQKNHPDWIKLRDRYANLKNEVGDTKAIPSFIHQIWIGGPVPEIYQPLISKLKEVNPRMGYKLWNESNLDFDLVTGDLIHHVKNPGQKSDILRYEILNKYGGIYLDLDFDPIRSFDSLLGYEFFSGIVYSPTPSLANGLIGCVPQHPIIQACLERVKRSRNSNGISEIMKQTGPFMFTDVFMEMFENLPRSVVLPVSYFYPFPHSERYKKLGNDYEKYIGPSTICVHQWHCSWMKTRKSKPAAMLETLKMKIRHSRLLWVMQVVLCGLDLNPGLLLRRLRAFPKFYKDLQLFKSQTDWTIQVEPRLDDAIEQAGSLGEYFWQDLFLARRILELAPEKHVDVGSRIDGFVGHLACTRKLDVIDIRPLTMKIPGVTFHQIDITSLPESWLAQSDCVTCLHSIEHFGLGRYGDPLDPDGWKTGLLNLSRLVKPGGRLILSTPIGSQRVKFNSHRIFHPATIAKQATEIGLKLDSFAYHSIEGSGESHIVVSENWGADFDSLGAIKYSLGIFEFKKCE